MYDKLKLLKSLSVNYPVIESQGYGCPMPIMVITDEKNKNGLIECLINLESVSINEFMKKKDIDKALTQTNSEFVMLHYSATPKGREILDYIVTVMRSGTDENRRVNAIPLVIAEGKICREDIRKAFVVFLEGDISEVKISLSEVVPPDKQVEVVLDKMNELDMDGKGQMEKALLAAACFLYPSLKRRGRISEFADLLKCVHIIESQHDEGGLNTNLAEMFVSEMYRWQERTGFHDVFALPEIEMSVSKRMDEVILYDKTFFYMRESFFVRIVHPLLVVFPLDVLRFALADSAILCPEEDKTYSVKVNFYNIAGEYDRIRMLRFRRSAFMRCGELEFIDICIGEKEDEGYEY